MEWRCEWCGKPHEEDDPPCDNCGHGTFEKAVVRQTDLSTDGPETTLVWVCTSCGREHTKHSPPCSRCGSPTLEKRKQGVDENELSAPSYLDLLTPRYAAVLIVVAGIVAVLGLGFLGVIDLPGVGNSDVPGVENVPGNGTSTENGLSLTAVEDAFVERLNDERATVGVGTVKRDGRLDDIARLENQQRVKADIQSGTVDEETVNELILEQCETAIKDTTTSDLTEVTDPETAAAAFAFVTPQDLREEWDSVGVDVHSVGGEVYVQKILCR
jgi:DNA-directed RNA polymerase subunit RPC12/RpoP